MRTVTGRRGKPVRLSRMGPLGPRALRASAGVLGVVGALALASAGVRLLPWLLDRRVPLASALVFARGLALVSLEVAVALALPIGFALAAASFSDRGEARACQLAGASPARLALGTLPIALVLSLLAVVPNAVWGGAAASSHRTLVDLIDASRGACDARSRPVADVPGASVSWLCAEGAPPRLARVSRELVVTAATVTLDEDLRGARLGDVTVALRGPPELRVTVGEARVRGLGGFGDPAGPVGGARTTALCLAAVVSALACATLLLDRGEGRRAVALALGAASAILPLVLLRGAPASWALLVAAAPLALAPSCVYALAARMRTLRGAITRPRCASTSPGSGAPRRRPSASRRPAPPARRP